MEVTIVVVFTGYLNRLSAGAIYGKFQTLPALTMSDERCFSCYKSELTTWFELLAVEIHVITIDCSNGKYKSNSCSVIKEWRFLECFQLACS